MVITTRTAMHAAVFSLTTLLLVAETNAVDGYGLAGPFRLIVERMEPCAPDLVDLPYNVSFKMIRDRIKPSRFYLFGNLSWPFTLDDSVSGVVNFESWSSRGGWKPNAFHLSASRFCSLATTQAPQIVRRFMASMFDDANRKCPVTPGFYYLQRFLFSVDDEMKAIPAFFYGKYRVTGHFVDTLTRKRLICAVATLSVIPKFVHA